MIGFFTPTSSSIMEVKHLLSSFGNIYLHGLNDPAITEESLKLWQETKAKVSKRLEKPGSESVSFRFGLFPVIFPKLTERQAKIGKIVYPLKGITDFLAACLYMNPSFGEE